MIKGLSEKGYMTAVDCITREAYELHPDFNSLDYLTNMIKVKNY
jgi:hypothetical protein